MDGLNRMYRVLFAVAVTTAVLAGAAGAPASTVPLQLWHSAYDWPAGNGSSGWSSVGDSADPFAYGLGTPAGGAPGPWIWLTGGREYRPGGAEWRLTAPGTTRIAAVTFELAYRDKLFAHHCLEVGLRSPDELRDVRSTCAPPEAPATQEHYAVTLADPAPAPTAKDVFLRVEMPQCQNPAPTPCSKWVPKLDPVRNGASVRASRVSIDLVDDDQPTASASGALRDLADGYVDGHESYAVTVAGDDPGSGVRRVALVRDGTGQIHVSDAPCDPKHHTAELAAAICPAHHEAPWSFDTANLDEGAVRLTATAADLAGNAAEGDAWRFFVDRTAPPAPTDFDVDLDADAELATVSWLAEDDPALADGSPGSGLAEWEYRFRRNNDDWSAWHRGAEALEVPASIEGDGIDVEARSLDAVGNASPITSTHVVVPTEDEEDDTVENEDDDEDPSAPIVTAESADLRSASRMAAAPRSSGTTAHFRKAAQARTISLQFVAASAAAREQALAAVGSACAPPLRRASCYDAVRAACKLAGICTKAKQQACAGVKLYCPKADASRVSLVDRFQPTFVMDRGDGFWPVSVNTALTMRWDGRTTCVNFDDDCVARGAEAVRRKLGTQRARHDNEYLDLPPHKDDVEDFMKATQDALGIRPRIDFDGPRNEQDWAVARNSSRVYWYRGGGFGRGTNSAKSLQYWTFYTYNYLKAGFLGDQGKHEGDWEMYAVLLNREDQPVYAYMSVHGMNYWDKEARVYNWADARLSRDGTHAVVYPAKGSHAVYATCGDHARGDGAPDDHSSCNDVLNLGPETRRISLGRSSWSCWGGHFGKGATDTLHRYGDSPYSPLWQQDTFGGDRRPCADGDPSAASVSAASIRSADGSAARLNRLSAFSDADEPEETESVTREMSLSAAGDPLLGAVSSCDAWNTPPTQPGALLVACDQRQLDRFVADGLTGDGGGGPQITTANGVITSIPATYATDDPARLEAAKVVSPRDGTAVYAARLGVDGTLLEARFAAADVPDGQPLTVRFRGAESHLVSTMTNQVVATATTTRTQLSRFRRVARARGLRAVRRHRAIVLSWRGSPTADFVVSAGPTADAAGRRRIRTVHRSRTGRYRARVRLRRKERWAGVLAVRGSATSALVRVRVQGSRRR